MIISVFDRVENIVGKGEIACTSNFPFSHNVLKWLLSQTRENVSLCGNGIYIDAHRQKKKRLQIRFIEKRITIFHSFLKGVLSRMRKLRYDRCINIFNTA